ncbi:MAG: TonB-dependent receptor, partial [Spirosomaceae bacterium]|nr:TonB-dependent receptor [Spirosomataceae bacterium]
DILRGLQMLPGVSSVGEAANGVNIRGGTTDQNLMLLDGAPIFNPTHMFGLFSAFPSEAVSGFDLYKGNVPARFGGRAAAVLEVTLKQPSLEKFSMEGGISVVSNRLKMDIPLIQDKLGIMISGRGAFNSFLLPLISDQFDNIRANFGDAASKLFWRINNKNTFSASAYYSKDFFQTELLGTIADINATSTQFDYQTVNFSGQWFRAINKDVNLQTSFATSDYVPRLILPELNTGNKVSIESGVDFRQIKSNLNFQKGSQKIEAGVDATYYIINPGQLNPGQSPSVLPVVLSNEKGLELGIFVENEVDINEKLTVSGGLRYSHFLNLGPADVRIYDSSIRDELALVDTVSFGNNQVVANFGGFEPRFGLRYNLTPRSSVKFGYNLMRQYIQVVSNTTTPIPTARWKTSDRYIKPQVSSLITAGYFKQLEDNIYEYSIEGYYRSTDNIIDYRPGANFLLQQFPESELLQGFNRSYGLELMASKKKGELTGWVNYTYSRSLNQVNEGPALSQQVNFGNFYAANYDRPHTFNSSIVINQGKYHDFSFNFTYSTGRPFTTPTGSILFQEQVFPFYDVRNNARLPDYHRLDFAWNIYNPSMKDRRFKGNWTFTIYNLYGRKNAYSIFLRTVGTRVEANRLTIFGAPMPSLSYNFTFD